MLWYNVATAISAAARGSRLLLTSAAYRLLVAAALSGLLWVATLLVIRP